MAENLRNGFIYKSSIIYCYENTLYANITNIKTIQNKEDDCCHCCFLIYFVAKKIWNHLLSTP